jgi:long-chain acyl-CoA synthetase
VIPSNGHRTRRRGGPGPHGTTSIAIVGCGFGGLAAAIELKRAGMDNFTIFERASSVGGVWRENTYPGAACDVPSPIYSFSYALKPDWSGLFGKQDEIHRYLDEVTREFGITDHIRFDTEVTAAVFDEDTGQWLVTTAAGDSIRTDLLLELPFLAGGLYKYYGDQPFLIGVSRCTGSR